MSSPTPKAPIEPQPPCARCGKTTHTTGYHDSKEPTGYHDSGVPTEANDN
jgi:hypothetical protein